MKAWRFVRRWWWAIVLSLAAVAWFLWRIFGPRPGPDAPVVAPKFLDMARSEVERVHLEAEVEKAKVRTKAEAQRNEIAAIEERGKTDPAAARRDLAAFLATNL